MRLVIASVHTKFFDGEAYSITAPGAEGELTVLSHHMPFITNLKKGELRVKTSSDEKPITFPIESGILEVAKDSTTVLL
jgi:F-type H+-transporting ATPase subunit epsilon